MYRNVNDRIVVGVLSKMRVMTPSQRCNGSRGIGSTMVGGGWTDPSVVQVKLDYGVCFTWDVTFIGVSKTHRCTIIICRN